MNGRELGVVPARVDADDADKARDALAGTGSVILTGLSVTPDALVVAAAHLYGQHLRQLFPIRERASREGGPVHLHADSFDQVVDIGGVPSRRRDPDEDAVLVQCVRPAPTGGDSFLLDAYRYLDTCPDQELVDFLTDVDVDLYGEWAGLRGLPAAPRVGRHVEYTRTGRRIARRTDGAVPLHRDPDAEHITAMVDRFQRTVHALEADLPRVRLEEGDILAVDNYRCWHGRDPHTGDRAVRILTLRTDAAR
ncbi:TauD/TfdA family dioxygenase [Saccharothrix luteola]|uniref:TauD/TfdA family dioxygenase n=1 Tax=Saccharothrix luteola TaxID=2893018 RepID=UPI001E29EE65|nr:TauD/TfdA family dioxygenase [Saccharothrix luteola]MCC8242857.1 TauD/TfdA family dioxygenase [Saccharothrix luteola]